MDRFKRIFITGSLAAAIAAGFVGCMDGSRGRVVRDSPTPTPISTAVGTPLPNPLKDLGGGTAVSLSDFNGKLIYTALTAEPSAKPESDLPPTASYSLTLTTTGGSSGSGAGSLAGLAASGRPSVYGRRQTERDRFLRAQERQTLASRIRQISRPAAGARSAPVSPTEGTVWSNLNILKVDNTMTTITATCRKVSTYAYFFVDNRDTAQVSGYLADYATTFDNTVYPTVQSKLGAVNDIDGNGKVVIVFSRELTGGLLGYFYELDKYNEPYSNQGDIIYITPDAEYQGNIVKATLAHELQHMAYFDQHYNLDVTTTYTWLNEALSQAAEYYCNFTENHLGWIQSFLQGSHPEISLTHWTSANYGFGAIFIRYLIDRFGEAPIKQMCSGAPVGIAAVETATGTDFNTLFTDFTRAVVMSGSGDSSDSRYAFTTLNLQTVQPAGRGGMLPMLTYTASQSTSGPLYPYQLLLIQWTSTFGTMTLSGTGVTGTAFGLSR